MNTTALARTIYDADEGVASGYSEASVFRKFHAPVEPVTSLEYIEASLDLPRIREIRPIPRARDDLSRRSFQLLQQWEGQVKQVTKDSLVAIVSDKTNPENVDEEVELSLSEIDPDDLRLVRPGALFYWAVGYEDGLGVPRQRVSRVRFQRLPGLTTRDIERAKENAKTFAALFE